MNSNFLKPQAGHAQSNPGSELIRTHAEILAADAKAKAAKRQVDLEELSSELRSPGERVRAWEQVHGLTLPLDPDHPILALIAMKTQLTVQSVQAVQRDNAARLAARPPAQL